MRARLRISASLALGACLLAVAPAQAAAPRMQRAYTVDSDRNGSVDAVDVRFSARLRGKPKASDFSVKGYRVTGVGKPRGRQLRLLLREGSSCDVGGSPVVTYRGRGLRGVRRGKLDMERRDKSPPRITCGVTLDADADGRVDGVSLTYSKRVRNRRQSGGTFLFDVDGYALESVEAARGRTLLLKLREHADVDTEAQPSVTYRRPRTRSARRYAVTGRGGQAFAGIFKAVRDRVAPLLLLSVTADTDADALLDAIGVAWSEPVTAGGFSVAGTGVTGVTAAAPDLLVLRLVEGPLGTGDRPALQTDPARPVRDGAGNAASSAPVTPADGAAPLILAAITADAGGQSGRLDTLALSFSEPVLHPSDSDGSTPFGVTGYTVTAAGAASGQRLDLSLAEGSGPDTGAKPPVGYTRGTGAPVTDAAGNEALTHSFAGTSDGVGPKLLSATTLDTDGNGRLDRVRFGFSEPVTHAAEAGPGSFSASGLTGLAAQAASGVTVDLTLTEAAQGNSGLRPTASYTADGTNDVADVAGNRAASQSVLQATDGAAPVVISAATADATGDSMTLDRVQLTLSEPVSHAEDTSAPFSFNASGFTVVSVSAAAGDQLGVNLQEPASPDTGSAPTMTYTGAGNKLLDASGLESAARAYPGLTRDALVPQRSAIETDDSDTNGKLDRVEVVYSEEVTGSTATGPFAVSGRTLQSVAYATNRVRLSFQEAGGTSYDTDARPDVSYTPGDVRDLPEGPGDTADSTPGFSVVQAADGAGPAPVEAVTLDADTDGKLDSLRVTFSEPLAASSEDLSPPFALDVIGRSETRVSPPGGSGNRELTVDVAEASTPDSGSKPSVAVTGSEPLRDQVTPVGNDAPVMTFAQTRDGVRPVMISAQLGDRPGGSGACDKAPVAGINGKVDCVRVRWSEEVSHAADATPPFPVSLSNGYSVAGSIPASSGTDTVDVPLTEKPDPDRDNTADVTYSEAVDEPVVDSANNLSAGGTIAADAACGDVVDEDNESRTLFNPAPSVGQPSLQRRCAFDDDWFRVFTGIEGRIKALVRPSPTLASELRVVDSSGVTVGSAAPANGAGASDSVDVTGLDPATFYWVHVSGADANPPEAEGSYCMALSITAADEPTCGPLIGQLVFTEAGLDGGAAAKFVELKNVNDFALEASGISLSLEVGSPAQSCSVVAPGGPAGVIDPGEYVVITDDSGPGPFTCDKLDQLSSAGSNLALKSSGSTIDAVDLSGVLTSPPATDHSLQVKPSAEQLTLNDDVQHSWCRTWLADTKAAAGDGCDEYRVNEVLFDPNPPSDPQGRPFVELMGNLPAKTGSNLLAGWVLRGVNGETGGGTADFALPSDASTRANGTFVVADGIDGGLPGDSQLPAAQRDVVWDDLDLADPLWPDLATANPGPRGIQLLRPNPPSGAPCGSALADVLGWRQTSESFTFPADSQRNCASVEGTPVAPIITPGRSAARDNLASGADTTYNTANDTGSNVTDFCRQTTPNPGDLNVRPGC